MGKSRKEKLDVYLEQNRSGQFKKIRVFKDKDNEDTTLGFYVSPRPKSKDEERVFTKIGEYIFKEDETLPTPEPEPPVDKKPVITGVNEVNARPNMPFTIELQVTDDNKVENIQWKQIMPEEKTFPEHDGKQTATFEIVAEGDYLFMVTAFDDKGQTAEHGINIHVRTQIPIPTDNFKPLLGFAADTDDDSDGVKSIKLVGGAASGLFGGDGPYGSSANTFTGAWSSNVSLERTMAAVPGNHDDKREDGDVGDAMYDYFKWPKDGKPAVSVTKVNQIGIIGMDSQDDNIGQEDGDQFRTVKGALEILRNDGMKFIIIVIHKPIYGTTYKHGDLKDVRALYQPLFDEYQVDAVLQGHNHQFWETYPLKSGAKITHDKSNFDYDFSIDHGQIYWGCGAGGRGLYTIGSNVPSYVARHNDNDHSITYIDTDEENPNAIRLRNIAHSGQVLHSTIIRKGQGTPQPKAPIIDIGENENTAGNINEEHQLSAKITDPEDNNNPVPVDKISWLQDSGSLTELVSISDDGWSYVFKATTKGEYKFSVQAEGKTGLVSKKVFNVTMRNPNEPEPTNLLWSSNIHGQWNDGKKRIITKKQGGQTTDDKSIFVAASGSPELIIDGDGIAHLKSGSGGVLNISVKGLCSHQGKNSPLTSNAPSEGSKRGGGEGFSLSHTEWNCKREKFHNEHDSIGSGSLPKKIEDYKWHELRFTWKHEGNEIHLTGEINYLDGNGFVKVMDEIDKNAEAWFFEKDGNIYIWIRLNNDDHGRIYIMAYNYDAQLTVPFMFEPKENSIALKDVELIAV